MISFKPCSEVRPSRTKPLLRSRRGLLVGADRVGFDDRRLQQDLQPAPRHRA
jgi:hypothetical protein